MYLDTFVYGGFYDDEFSDDTRALFNCINRHKIRVVTSEIVMKELEPAREEVGEVINYLHDSEFIKTRQGVKILAKKYIELGVVGEGSIVDATHIAMATLQGATSLVSWNMKHMVSRQDVFNVVNLRAGHKIINIYTK